MSEKIVKTDLTSPNISEIAAEQENKAVNENRTATFRARRAMLTPMPGGRRIDASRHMRARYTMRQEADILGDPESMLNEDWKRDHRGWRYQWPVRLANSTGSYIRSGWFIPVPYSAVNPDDPCAAIADIMTPGGKYIVWKNHLLVAVPPERYDLLVTQYEDYAIARTAGNAEATSDALERANPGFSAEIDAYQNVRPSKTGD